METEEEAVEETPPEERPTDAGGALEEALAGLRSLSEGISFAEASASEALSGISLPPGQGTSGKNKRAEGESDEDGTGWKGGLEDCWDREKFSRSMVVEALKLTRTEVSGLAGGVEYQAYEVNFHKEADKEATKRRIVEAGQTSPHNLFDATDLKRRRRSYAEAAGGEGPSGKEQAPGEGRAERREGLVPQKQAGPVPQKQAGPVPQKQAGPVPQKQAGPGLQKQAGPVPQEQAGVEPQEQAAGPQVVVPVEVVEMETEEEAVEETPPEERPTDAGGALEEALAGLRSLSEGISFAEASASEALSGISLPPGQGTSGKIKGQRASPTRTALG
ncbi:hypothetical protein DPEC_G00325230 [Dallia pectoralis]|uniref:Uncharacterized protein n=1 Tax=Dallia pectoralis TaxID=75939 RepID=A0ACC2FB56_DALPE|nr:hypothetical protein DPEC_G00325230 [Dallia pectoralis]